MSDIQKSNAKFGPAGNSDSFYQEGHSATVEMPVDFREGARLL